MIISKKKNQQYLSDAEIIMQGSHRLEKYLNLEGFVEESLKIKSALKKYWQITQRS